jgi:hypothetical protein
VDMTRKAEKVLKVTEISFRILETPPKFKRGTRLVCTGQLLNERLGCLAQLGNGILFLKSN